MEIKTKFSIFTVIVIFICIVSISYTIFLIEKRIFFERQEKELKKTISQFATVARESIIVKDDILAFNYLKVLKETVPGFVEGYILNESGIIIATTESEFLRKKFSEKEKYGIIRIEKDVISGSKNIGKVYIDFSSDILNRRIEENIKELKKQIQQTSLIVLVIGIIIAVFFAEQISKPIRKLVREVRSIADGNLDTKIDIDSKDEVGNLSGEFNRMTNALKILDHMKSDFVSNVSHELKSPIAAIESYINLMIEDKKEFNLENLMRIKNNSARLSRFIGDLLSVARIEREEYESEKKLIKLRDSVDDVVMLFKPKAEEKSIKVESNIPLELPDVWANSERLKQVFTNLISNAIKFTPAGGIIQVDAKYGTRDEGRETRDESHHPNEVFIRHPSSIVVSVSDTGRGIPEGQYEKIFDKFYQVKGTVDELKEHKGTGLGLAIVKGIIEEHNGKIWVESKEGKGTKFLFTLPVKKVEADKRG
ncbi:MAG: HAMP domain-containing histidine kinase [Elusimicrobia bacterium]|nr:HAMP domain-containing histidine kinase [Elusimicrobiota bacterium]